MKAINLLGISVLAVALTRLGRICEGTDAGSLGA